MKKSIYYILTLCLLFTTLFPKLINSIQVEISGNTVTNSIKINNINKDLQSFLNEYKLVNIKSLVFNDDYLINNNNSGFTNNLRQNGYEINLSLDLSERHDEYFDILQNTIKKYNIRTVYFEDKNHPFDYNTFIKISDLAKKNDLTIGLLENSQQNGLQYPELSLYSSVVSGIANRALFTDKKDLIQLSSNEIVLRLLRSVVDRGIRLSVFQADDADTMKLYDNISGELNRELSVKGYDISQKACAVTAKAGSLPDIVILISFTILILLIFLRTLAYRKNVYLFVLVLLVTALPLYFYNFNFLMILLTLIITVLIPSTVTILMYRIYTENVYEGSFLNTLKYHITVFLFYLISGLFVWLALSGYSFRMGFETYKLAIISYLAPILIVLLYVLKDSGYDVNKIKQALFKKKSLVIMLAAIFILSVYLSRSGNFSLFPASTAELYFRMFLEKILPARPRLKEFLIGYPAFFLLFSTNKRKTKTVSITLLLCSAVSGISILNTFCHGFTSVNVSIIRAFSGFIIGTFTASIAYFFSKTFTRIHFPDKTL